ncbi:MAG: YicC family protein [Acidobacteria bacterium]|nr:YicC family protein [Acidobacteriota bacterium]
MTIRSMTGYARLRRSIPEGELTVSLKTVNHRALDLHFHMSSFFDPVEGAMRNLVKQELNRGHVDIRCSLAREAAKQTFEVNRPLLDAYRNLFETQSGMGNPDLNEALRLPGMLLETREDEVSESLHEAILGALTDALTELNVQREREGAALAKQMLAYNENIHAQAAKVRGLRTQILPILRQKIEVKINDLLNGQSIDPARISQEAAFLADRGDVEEEITRLLTHCTHLENLLTKGGEAGKKIDFLLQEMNRETNTILSKSNNACDFGLQITEIGLAVKTEIERIREQSLNLE